MLPQRWMGVFNELGRSFADLARLPRALWIVIAVFVIDSMAYFGMLTLMTTFLSSDLGSGDKWAGLTVSLFTMLVTLFMLGIGSYMEGFGLRRALLFGLIITVGGRALYSMAPWIGSNSLIIGAVVASVLVMAIGSAILQPVCYSGVKQYTDEKTHSMGYALIYALMNAGIVVIGALSAWMRPAVQNMVEGKDAGTTFGLPLLKVFKGFSETGVQAVNWACVMVTGVALVMLLLMLTRKTEATKLRPDPAEDERRGPKLPFGQRLREFFAGGPFSNPRFIFFIFMLLPVRTLFAHQWLTFPQYIIRSYDKPVADKMEWLVNWINPAIIFVGVPLLTAVTRKANVYTMMIIGSFVSAAPTFLLTGGPDLKMLISYFVIFSIGEALWSARFLEYASELAPPGRVAQYMGLANIPWLLAKGTTGLYSGWMLATYCPPQTPPAQLETGTMWFIYGCIAMTSPIGLWLARDWVMKGLHEPGKRSTA